MAFFLASASAAFFSASAFLMRSSSSFFFLAISFSRSALISFLLLCFSFSLFSSSSSFDLSPLHELMYSFSCSFNSFLCIPAFLLAKASSPLAEVDEAFAKRKAGMHKNELNEQLKEYINSWRDERSKEEEELKRLKEKQSKRKITRRRKRRRSKYFVQILLREHSIHIIASV